MVENYNNPIVMLTADVDSDSKNRISDAGATDYFAKPIDTQRFYAKLTQYLGENSCADSDIERIPQGFELLEAQYKASFRQKSADIKQALNQQNWTQLEHLMHKIKGSAGRYGFDSISQIASEVEAQLEAKEYSIAKKLTEKFLQALKEESKGK